MFMSPRQIVFTAVLLGVPVASFLLVFRPQNQDIKKIKQNTELKQQALEKLRATTALKADLEREIGEIRKTIVTVEKNLPTSKELDTVLRDVAQIAAKVGLRVPKFSRVTEVQDAGTAREQQLDVEVAGDFDGFYNFLLQIEKLPRITRMTDLKLERIVDAAEDKDGLARASFKLSIYYQEGTSLVDVTPPPPAAEEKTEASTPAKTPEVAGAEPGQGGEP
jgi:type IV pilus assembly protein PilO